MVKICEKFSNISYPLSKKKKKWKVTVSKEWKQAFFWFLYSFILLWVCFFEKCSCLSNYAEICGNILNNNSCNTLRWCCRVFSASRNDWYFRLWQMMSETLLIRCLHLFKIKTVLPQIGCWITLKIIMLDRSIEMVPRVYQCSILSFGVCFTSRMKSNYQQIIQYDTGDYSLMFTHFILHFGTMQKCWKRRDCGWSCNTTFKEEDMLIAIIVF